MSVSLGANGSSYDYPETGELSWGANATNFASAVSAALTKLGLGAIPTASAVADIVSTTKGILIPRMTVAQRNAISSPATHLLVINSDNNTLDIYYNGSWNSILTFKPARTYSENDYQNTTTSTTFADVLSAGVTTWEVALTNNYSTSKIQFSLSVQYNLSRASTTVGGGIKVFRKIGAGAYSEIYTPLAYEIYSEAGGASAIGLYGRHNLKIQDSPNTTSEVKYKIQYAVYQSTSSGTMIINPTTSKSIITLEEIFV